MHRCTESLWPEAKGAYSALSQWLCRNFARLARGLRRRTELAGVDRVFVAIDAAHITNDTRKAMGRGTWRGVPFVYKRPISPDAKGPSSPVENTLLGDAIVDRTLCVRAKC